MATCVPNVTGKATCARTASPALVDMLRIEFTSVSEMTVPWGTVIVPLCGAGSCAADVCSCPVDVVTGTCAPQSEAIYTRATRRAAKRAIRTECDRIFLHPFHLAREMDCSWRAMASWPRRFGPAPTAAGSGWRRERREAQDTWFQRCRECLESRESRLAAWRESREW